MNNYETDYELLLKDCLLNGYKVEGRNGVVKQITGTQLKIDLTDGFPVVTGKKVFPNSALIETEWMLNGITNTKWLNERGVKIWDQWAIDGELGPVYGHQLLNFNGINQINYIKDIYNNDKYSRRLLVNMWNVNDLHKMQLPPCHYSFQFVTYDNMADIVVSMRSLDLFIGLPYDVMMYAAILISFCNEFNLTPKKLIINAANAHIYEEHFEAVLKYCSSPKYKLPSIISTTKFSSFKSSENNVINYKSNPQIKVNVKK